MFFEQHHLHPKLMSTNNILQYEDIAYQRCINALLDTSEADEQIAQTQDKYNIRTQGYFDTYKEGRKGFNYTLQWMDVICDFFEKVRNIVVWEDPSMTKLFFYLLLVLFLLVTFLPLRFIIFVAFVYKYLCGMRWQNKRVINNKEVCRIELLNFLEEKRLSAVITDFDKKWDSVVDTKQHSVQFLEGKLTNHF